MVHGQANGNLTIMFAILNTSTAFMMDLMLLMIAMNGSDQDTAMALTMLPTVVFLFLVSLFRF